MPGCLSEIAGRGKRNVAGGGCECYGLKRAPGACAELPVVVARQRRIASAALPATSSETIELWRVGHRRRAACRGVAAVVGVQR